MQFKKEITFGDIIGLLALIVAIWALITGMRTLDVNIKQLNVSIKEHTETVSTTLDKIFYEIKPEETAFLPEGSMRFFDSKKSSIKVINIEPTSKKVEVEVNIRGQITNEILITNKTRVFYTEKKRGISFILKEVSKTKKGYVAELVIAKF